jgi:hypothetical protein
MKDRTFQVFKKYILYFAEKKYKTTRKRKYSFDYYIKCFIQILSDYNKWENLKLDNDKPYHWKSIYNEFNKWSKDNIFEEAFNCFIKENYFKLSKLKKNKSINLFIDVTKINNKSGSENIGINVEYKKKNITSLTVICDINKIPIGIKYVDINIRPNKKNTFKHEIKNVQNTLNTIPINFKGYKVNLIGDKGYITQKKFKLGYKKISIITPKRKNQKIQNTYYEKELLKDRHKIENFFASLKTFNRISLRKDKNITNYMSFVYIGLLKYVFNYNDMNGSIIINLPNF